MIFAMKSYKKLLLVFLIFAAIKVILSYFVSSPSMFADEYWYAKFARNLFVYGRYIVHGAFSSARPPLYPILLSISYLFKDMTVVYFVMKVINAIVSSLVIFPIWLLSKEFLSERKAFLVTVLAGIFPSLFAFSPYIMAENLFFPLFFFSVYFLYKSFLENGYKWDILAGIFIGLAYLTRTLAVIFIPVIILILIVELFRKREFMQIKKKLVLGLVALLVVSPLVIVNILNLGVEGDIIGQGREDVIYLNLFSPAAFSYWFVFYIGYFVLAAGVLFFITNFTGLFNEKRKVFVSIIFALFLGFVGFAAYHSSLYFSLYKDFAFNTIYKGRSLARYFEFIIPLFLINGAIGLKHIKRVNYKILLAIGLFLAGSFSIYVFKYDYSLFPINNLALTHIGVLNLILSKFNLSFVLLGILFLIPFVFLLKLEFKTWIKMFIGVFILLNLLVYSASIYNSYENWYKLDQMQLGLWFNSYDSGKRVLFDERDDIGFSKEGLEKRRPINIMGFWMNDDIRIGDVKDAKEFDYVVSTHEIELEILKKQGKVIIYKV